MKAATTGKLPSTKIVLRRWMPRIRCFVQTLHTLKAACTFV
jgi:hypothetical protein